MSSRVYSRNLEILHFYPRDYLVEKDKCAPLPASSSTDVLPANLTWFGAQIAGHKTQLDEDGQVQQLGFLKDRNCADRILKPVMNDKRGKREKNFYLDLFCPSAPSALSAFRLVVPYYFGMRDLTYKGTTHELLELEDMTESFRLPAVIDVKIGQRTWGPDATEDKISKERAKYPAQEEIGFRILGYKVENSTTGLKKACKDRASCLKLKPADINGALKEYFSHRGCDTVDMLQQVLAQLDEIRDAMTTGVFHFYSSSVLIAYEAHPDAPPRAVVKMIDFSHVFDGNGVPDKNYLYGLNSLARHLCQIRNGAKN